MLNGGDTFKSGGDTQNPVCLHFEAVGTHSKVVGTLKTLSAENEFELFAFRGSGDDERSSLHPLNPLVQ